MAEVAERPAGCRDRLRTNLVRLLFAADLLAQQRQPVGADEFHRLLSATWGNVCRRTVYRELQTLEEVGLAVRQSKDGCRDAWQYNDEGFWPFADQLIETRNKQL